MPNLYNIPASLPFAETLVRGILDRYRGGNFSLVDILLLLPNRRSCKTVQEAFLKATNGQPVMLPKMQPLGDVEDDELIFKSGLEDINLDPPVVISNTRRRLLLGKIVKKFQETSVGKNKITTAQSVNLAIELASFLDAVQKHELKIDKIRNIVPEELAGHWQASALFIEVVLKNWPAIMAQMGVVDIITHRNTCLKSLAGQWENSPPSFPVIAAGSTGSIPATANLLKVIASMPNGLVVLPALDNFMDDGSWNSITETHHQYALKNLIENIVITRNQVKDWVPVQNCTATTPDNMSLRSKFISQIMLPAAVSYKWQEIDGLPDAAIKGVSKIVAPTQQDEARIIAMVLRDTLEYPGKTAALITNDQSLVLRVMAMLQKWDVQIDSSTGIPLAKVAPCVFMLLIARMLEEKISPVSMLACLKHPLASAGMDPDICRKMARQLEINLLRGLYNKNGFSGIKDSLAAKGELDLVNWVKVIEAALLPFSQLMQTRHVSFDAMVKEHIKAAETLAATDKTTGAARLWGSDQGEALKEFFYELSESAGEIGDIKPSEYSGALEALLIGKVYRPKYNMHPCISILSPIEARMQTYDLCILGSLNEGIWPPAVECGPWMGRPMRKSFGLPSPETSIGLAAHDFVEALHTKEVLLTRCEKADGTATVPSRWLLQLETVLGIFDKVHLLEPDRPWLEWSHALTYTNKVMPCSPPQPCPPSSVRPLEIAATQVEKLIRNPYGYYAEKILRLKKLDAIGMEPGGREFGIIVHEAIESLIAAYNNIHPDFMLQFLNASWLALLKKYHISAPLQASWQPRFEKIANDFVKIEQERRGHKKIFSEVRGFYNITLQDGRGYRITARVDRLELDEDGKITIIDYKTKSAFSGINKKFLNGELPQLPLEALIAYKLGFKDVSGMPASLAYWFMTSGNDAKAAIEECEVNVDMEELLAVTAEGIEQLANVFSQGAAPYKYCPNPNNESDFDDYGHLARKKEWA